MRPPQGLFQIPASCGFAGLRVGMLEPDAKGSIHKADNLDVPACLPSASVGLIYIDQLTSRSIPVNTGRVQRRTQVRTVRSDTGDRIGFQGGATPAWSSAAGLLATTLTTTWPF